MSSGTRFMGRNENEAIYWEGGYHLWVFFGTISFLHVAYFGQWKHSGDALLPSRE